MVAADIGAAIRSAWAFFKVATPRAWAAVGLYTLAAVAAAVEPALGLPTLWLALSTLVQLALSLMAYGALYRLAVGEDHPGDPHFRIGPGGLQWRAAEWRVGGAMLLTLFFAFMIMLAVGFVALLAATVVYVSQGAKPTTPGGFFSSPGGIAMILVGLVGVVMLTWAMLRLSLALPATVDRGRVQVFATWGLTKGHLLAILGCAILIGLPVLALGLIASLLQQNEMAGAAVAMRVVMALIVGGVQLPLGVGVYAWFYRRVTEPARAAASHN